MMRVLICILLYMEQCDSLKACGTCGTSSGAHSIRQISILGERNSGTTWFSQVIKDCFPGLVVVPRMKRFKHWFQHDEFGVVSVPPNVLPVVLTRNVYSWVDGMKRKPWHAPSHSNKTTWIEFTTKQWTLDEYTPNPKLTKCQEGFERGMVVPCKAGRHTGPFSSKYPVYEMNYNKTPFANIFHFRREKLLHFMSIPTTIHIKYDDLLRMGSHASISKISRALNINPQCSPIEAQPHRIKPLQPDFIRMVNARVDWAAERVAGYLPQPP